MMTLSAISDPNNRHVVPVLVLLTLLLTILTVWLWKRSEITEYQLFLTTSSSETQAFVSRSLDAVSNLRASIEAAMTARSPEDLSEP
jgi:hypothetical protein